MIKIENIEYEGFIPAIRGMRNPMNSWDKSDSGWDTGWPSDHGILIDSDSDSYYECRIGPNDQELMRKLAKAGSVHAKYRRFIVVYMDITAPLYWWKEFDTYRTGATPNPIDIEMNSCSTMHKIQAKEFTLEDFSCEHLGYLDLDDTRDEAEQKKDNDLADALYGMYPVDHLLNTIDLLNVCREKFLETKDKHYWWQMIQLLPSSYNQKRTVMLNYEVLANIYKNRKDHKLDEWRIFCQTMKEELPMSELFTGEE